MKSKSQHEERFALQIQAMKLPEPQREYRWAAELVRDIEDDELGLGFRQRLEMSGLRDWRFDFAWPEFRLAFEIEGLHSVDLARGYGAGRHLTPKGFTEDAEKYTEARLHGWSVYPIPAPWVKEGKAIDILVRALKFHGRLDFSQKPQIVRYGRR